MARRNQLHKSRLQAFKDWMTSNGIEWREGKGGYQVIQVKTDKGWPAIYDSDKDRREHYTVQEGLLKVVSRFIREAK